MDREERLQRQKEFLIQVAYWLVWSVAIIVALKYIGAVVFPFALAFLIAWGLSFLVNLVVAKLHFPRKLVAVLFVILFYGIVALLLYLLGNRVALLIQGCLTEVTTFLRNNVHISELTSGVSQKVFDGMSEAAVRIPEICMNLFLTVIATVLIELEFPDICAFVKRQIPRRFKGYTERLQKYVMGTLGKCAISYCLILLLTFAELTVGFLLLRIEGAIIIALVIAILDIFPVLGTGTVLLPWAVIVSATGNLTLGMGLLLLYLVITVVRNIVEPHLVGKQMGLSPIVTLVSMIAGLHFLGIIGMILLPLGVALVKTLDDSGVIHLFHREDDIGEKGEKMGKL